MKEETSFWSRITPYDAWIESLGLPVYKGYYIEDPRKLQLGWWEERQCYAGFLQLTGQEGVTGAYVTEIPPGESLPPFRMALDEVIYVLQGRGLTTVQAGASKKTFEWDKRSLFRIPGGWPYQLSNAQGAQSVRLLHCNYLPLALSALPDPDFFLKNSVVNSAAVEQKDGSDVYSHATVVRLPLPGSEEERNVWTGNFFPDMSAWDRLDPFKGRGAGGRVVWVGFPGSPLTGHMSVFPAQSYKKAHRHGPGYMIVIPVGEGYSIMWPEGGEKVVIPWREASIFVPPNRWFHQHFNVDSKPARYLAIHPPRGFRGISEKVEDRARDQIEYPDEDPWIRGKFEQELGARNLRSLMPEEAYRSRDFEWSYAD